MKYKLIITLCLFAFASKANDTLTFTLTSAIDYALENNLEYKSSTLDVTKANYRIKEITATGLPQISGSIDFRDQIKLPVFVFPDPVTGEQTPIQVGTRYQAVGALQLNQLIFDGSYFIGLRAAKEYRELASKIHQKNEQDLKVNVAKTYFLALVSQENLKLLEKNIETLSETLRETEGLYKAGFVELLDVDRLKLSLSNLQVQKVKIMNNVEITQMLLKAYLGLEITQPLVLTENLEVLYEKYAKENLPTNGNEKNRVELKIMERQIELNRLDMDRYKVQRYPSIRGFANYQQQFFGDQLTFSPWYNTALWGVSVNVPIFSSGVNSNQIRQARVSLQQSEYSYMYASNMMKLERMKSEKEFQISLSMLAIQKENFELAQRIVETTKKKYQAGVGSNLEVINANQELKVAQTNYLEAIYEMLVNRLNLQIANGEQLTF